jgi:glycosyltransferase involved in cell wall biosynthesis
LIFKSQRLHLCSVIAKTKRYFQITSVNITIVSTFESKGGAGRAANRLHRSFVEQGLNSRMRVQSRQSGDWLVTAPKQPFGKIWSDMRSIGEVILSRFQKSLNPILHSPGYFSSLKATEINRSDADVINLHWVGDGFVSVNTVAKIKKPVVWTLHDSWVFCGSEHHPHGSDDSRYVDGYRSDNRPLSSSGVDLDKWVWNRKKKLWKRPIHLVTPSAWLGATAKQSALAKHWPLSVIPNAVATDLFKPCDKNFARDVFQLPKDKKILLFGALSYQKDLNKGYDLLKKALITFVEQVDNPHEYVGVVFGQSASEHAEDLGLPLHYVGYLNDDQSLSMLYNAADVVIVPSRMENLPQTATEAQSCGVPVVAFNTCGIPEAVVHLESGYLAKPYDTDDLANGIQWVLSDDSRYKKLCEFARKRAVTLWSPDVVTHQYYELFKQVLREPRRL